MATLRLGRYEIERYDMPEVCLRCGARARHYKSKRFVWSPPWLLILLLAGVFPYAIAAGATQRQIRVTVPLCDRHRWHWGGRTAVICLALLGIFILFFAAIALAGAADLHPAAVFIPFLVLLVAWLGMTIFLAVTMIRPAEITDRSLTLTGVSEAFVEALNEERRGDVDDRSRRPHPRRDEDDERASRSEQRPTEEDDEDAYFDPKRRRRQGRTNGRDN
jgi:hypothetical protein